jgi:hypothetical protein
MDVNGTLLSLLFAGIGFYVLYWVIRVGVRGGMRDHAEWRESRASDDIPPPPSAG